MTRFEVDSTRHGVIESPFPHRQMILLHRHGSAGDSLASPRLDRARPLDRQGRADARELVKVLAPLEITRVVSSPLRRCVESVRPLANARGLEIELRDELEPDAPPGKTRALLRELPDFSLVCTHREVIERLFHGKIAAEKGGTWVLARKRGRLVPVEYLPPPTTVQPPLGAPVRSS
jgi:phosphohistidine phosphatase SixA